MMNRKQNGMTMLGFLITLAVVMFFLYSAMKIVPMYIEFYSVKKALASIANGYDKASGTIADANVTALLAGVAMAVFGSGPIRGFGITLIIGILTSMFSAVVVSRALVNMVYGRARKLEKLSIGTVWKPGAGA